MVKNHKVRTLLVKDRSGKEEGQVVERTAQELVLLGLPQFYVYHLIKIQHFYFDVLKIPKEKIRFYELDEKERAFYNKYHFDIEIELQEFGFTEVGGLHYRTDHDLKGHERVSGQKMEIFDEESASKFVPHVLELSFGVDRNTYALVDLNYDDDKERGNIVLHLPPKATPFFCAVFPLVKNKPEITAKAEEIYTLLKKQFTCFYDETASVGRRYARADEIGVRYCITVDFETLGEKGDTLRDTVTIRDRDSTQQERIKISQLSARLSELYSR